MDYKGLILTPDNAGNTGGFGFFHTNDKNEACLVNALVGVQTFPIARLDRQARLDQSKRLTIGRKVHPFWSTLVGKLDAKDTEGEPFEQLSQSEKNAIRNLWIDEINWSLQQEAATEEINNTVAASLDVIHRVISTFGPLVHTINHVAYDGAQEYGVSVENLKKREQIASILIPEKCGLVNTVHLQGHYFGPEYLLNRKRKLFLNMKTLIIGNWFYSKQIMNIFDTTGIRELSLGMEELVYYFCDWELLSTIQTLHIRHLNCECENLVEPRGENGEIPSVMSKCAKLETLILSSVSSAKWEDTVPFINKTTAQCPSLSVLCLDDSFLKVSCTDPQLFSIGKVSTLHIQVPVADKKIFMLIHMMKELDTLNIHGTVGDDSVGFYKQFPWGLCPNIRKIVDWTNNVVYPKILQ